MASEGGSSDYKPKTRRAAHPFLCRMANAKGFDVNSPQSLIGSGFASMGLAFFSFFRLSPFILYFLTQNLLQEHPSLNYYNAIVKELMLAWMVLIMFILIGTGFIQLLSMKMKKPGFLMVHPWCLLLLYLDVFVWLSLGSLLCEKLIAKDFNHKQNNWTYQAFFLSVFFVDVTFFFGIYYFYATYFIVAQLTVIEKYYLKMQPIE